MNKVVVEISEMIYAQCEAVHREQSELFKDSLIPWAKPQFRAHLELNERKSDIFVRF